MSDVWPYLPFLTKGILVTLQVTACGMALALAVAVLGGIGRTSRRRPVRVLSGFFIEIFRGISVIVLLFWFFYALPLLGAELSPFAAAVLALGLNGGAYGAEIVRAGLQSVPIGQREAAIALSLSPRRTLFKIVLPQAFVLMIPPFGNMSIEMLKATSLVSLVTVTDLTFRAQLVRASSGETTIVFTIILVFYLVIAIVFSIFWKYMERRFAVDRPAGRNDSSGPLPTFGLGRLGVAGRRSSTVTR
jgi:polar amino acid transport system permease protein